MRRPLSVARRASRGGEERCVRINGGGVAGTAMGCAESVEEEFICAAAEM
jgi:hypothetical protein